MTFQQFRGPALPVAQKPFQSFQPVNTRVTPQKFGGSRRRTCARVEQHDGNFSARKRLIDDRQVAQYQRQKTEAQSAFEYSQHPLRGSVRSNVAKAQRKKSCAAQIEARLQSRMRLIYPSVAEIQKAEAQD